MADDGGLAHFQKRMRELPVAIKMDARKVLEKSAQEIVDLAKRLCPVDEGDLRDSIGWTFGAAPAGSLALARSTIVDDMSVTIYAGNDKAFHARFVEFGTQAGVLGQRVTNKGAGKKQSSKGRFARRTHGGTAAQPFFFPAYRLLEKKVTGRIKRAVSKSIRKNGGLE